MAWLGWAVTKIPAVSGFLPFPGSKYTQKEAPNIFTSDFMDNLVVFDLYNLAQVSKSSVVIVFPAILFPLK